MPIEIIRADITTLNCDAIVNAANNNLYPGGGVCGAIHQAAGSELGEACGKIGWCDTGDAVITDGFDLPCNYVIHTVGPMWKGGHFHEKELLASCYKKSIELAIKNDCKSIAFPLISSGIYGYPKDKALEVARETLFECSQENDIDIYLVIFDKTAFDIGKKLLNDITEYIDQNYVDMHYIASRPDMYGESQVLGSMPAPCFSEGAVKPKKANLNDIVNKLDESFSESLLRRIDEKGMTDSECYKKANIDRKLFSKIRSNPQYKPSKPTAIAFAVALELSLDETKDLLMKAGFALSHSNKFDVIIEYFIKNEIYDVMKINEALFAFDQNLLGA